MSRVEPWRGVRWFTSARGNCTKHDEPVGWFTGLCPRCHREQLDAAEAGSREWELMPNQKWPTAYEGSPP